MGSGCSKPNPPPRDEERPLHVHPATLDSVNNLGLLLQDQKRLDEALPLLEEALAGSHTPAPLPARGCICIWVCECRG